MQKSENIVRYTAAELDEMLARGEDQTNWAYVDALTEEELEASIDWEEEGIPLPYTTRAGHPWHTQTVTIPIDRDITAWFQNRAPAYKLQIIAVLVNYVFREERRAQQAEPDEHPPHQRRAS